MCTKNCFHFRICNRRNYLVNPDSYGQSLLENCDDLEYSSTFGDGKSLEDEELDICEECQQNNLLHGTGSIIKDPTELKIVHGCRRNQHLIQSTKDNPISINIEERNKEKTNGFHDDAGDTKNTNYQIINTSVAFKGHTLRNAWKKIKGEFSAKLIDIPDEDIKGQNDSVKDAKNKTGFNTFPERLSENCSCNEGRINNYCNRCLVPRREGMPKSSTVESNGKEKNVYHPDPILAPIRSVYSHIND